MKLRNLLLNLSIGVAAFFIGLAWFNVFNYLLACESVRNHESTKVQTTTFLSNRTNGESAVRVLGAFSNRSGNGEHEWGYHVDIWKHNENLVGMLSGSDGTRLVGDPPTGVLKNIMYDSHTGKISFRATLPGVEYEFKGTLSAKELTGELFNSFGETTENVVLLKLQKWTTEMMDEYPSLDAWEERMDELIEFRGVKRTPK